MFPKMEGQPGSGYREVSPAYIVTDGRMAEGIGHMVHRPPFRSESLARSHPSRNPYRIYPVGQGNRRFAEVAHFGRPIIHLDVDIGMEIRVPRGLDLFVPYALQVGRKPAGPAGRACEKIPSILEIKGSQRRILSAFFHLRKPLIRRNS